MTEETKAITDGTSSLEQFSQHWERSSDLRDALSRLPGHLVLKSGLSARRNKLVEGWDKLESPGLDGDVSDSAVNALRKWIHEAEISIAHIVQIGNQEKSRSIGHEFAATDEVAHQFETVSSIEDVDFVSEEWSFPWEEKWKTKRAKSFDKDKLFKYGAFGALGLIAVVAYMDEDSE